MVEAVLLPFKGQIVYDGMEFRGTPYLFFTLCIRIRLTIMHTLIKSGYPKVSVGTRHSC